MGCQMGKGGSDDEGDDPYSNKRAGNKRGGGGGGGGGGNKDALPTPAPMDPRLPLTAKQKFSILASWKGINRAMESTGVLMFIKLFEENEELLNLFEKFRDLRTRDQQAQSMELAEHATTVMNTLDESIKSLDNLDYFFDYLHQVGASHRKIPNFQKQYFWRIEGPFLESVKTTLGDRYSENVESIYKIAIKFIIESLVKGYEAAEGAGG